MDSKPFNVIKMHQFNYKLKMSRNVLSMDEACILFVVLFLMPAQLDQASTPTHADRSTSPHFHISEDIKV